MRGRLFGLLLGAAAVLPVAWVATSPPPARAAARVLVMGAHGRVTVHTDRFLNAAPTTPVAVKQATPHSIRVAARAAAVKKRPPKTARSELTRLYRSGQISASAYSTDTAAINVALAAARRLRGTRARELNAVLQNLHEIAVSGQLTPSRLPALMLTLDTNRQWWTSGPIPATYQRIEFAGSQLVWEYYPGQGLELQVLGTFGRADGMYTAGSSQYPQLQQLLGEMIPLAARRAGGLVWEYYFHFDGGSPPWASAMSQGTALEALTRASLAFGSAAAPPGSTATYLQVASQALPVFTVAPPAGVRVGTAAGARYVQYTFTPRTDIINAFLQSLIGLYDYAKVSGDPEAQQLFAAGNAQAQAELPRFDTGAWSLYQPGVEDDLSYHELVTGFLDQMCSRTGSPVYCTTASHFHSYLKIAPTLQLLTSHASAKSRFGVRFRLSKVSRVGIVVQRGQNTVFQTSASFGYGVRSFAIPPMAGGTYSVRLAATDLAGNFNRINGTLQLTPAKRHSGGASGH